MTALDVRDGSRIARSRSMLDRVALYRRNQDSAWSRLLRNPDAIAIGLGLVFTCAAWPAATLAPSVGLDQSWGFGLASSAVHHIEWGPDLDFAYGPLGFLTVRTLYFGSTAALAFVCQFVILWALFTLLYRFIRATLPLPVAVLVSYGIGATTVALVDLGDLLMAPTFLLAILAVRHQQPRVRRFLITVIAVVSAAGFFIKFADGLIPLVIVVVIVSIGPRKTRVLDGLLPAVTFAVVLVAAWWATGNGLGSLPTYFRYSADVAGGYSSAMQLEIGRTDEWWYAGIVLVVTGILTFLCVRSRGRREQIGTALILIVYAWWALKEGFVRHDGHDLIFFGLMFVTLAVFDVSLPRFRLYYITTVGVVGIIVWSAAGAVPANLLALSADVHGFGSQINTIVSRKDRTATTDAARTKMQQIYALNPTMLTELENHSVAIEPWENSVAWAYPTIRWDPEPVLQAYSAFTSSLDALDSQFIASPRAPARILEQPSEAVDGRDPTFEPPTTTATVVCHYDQLDASSTWQVLARVSNRCGPTRFISSQTATMGMSVRVPVGPSGTMVVARISLHLPLTYKLASIVLKPPITYLSVPGARYRFVVGTADDLHLMRPASSVGYSPPFLAPSIPSFELSGGGVAPGTGRFVVSFYSIRVAPGRTA
jgi:hypothetical protein